MDMSIMISIIVRSFITIISTIENIVVPRVSPLVYEGISMDNIAPYPLLSGTVHIQNNGSYMGTHPISYTGTGEPIELAIAQLPEIKVVRTTLHDKRTSQILGKNKNIQRAYEIKISNNSKVDRTLEIRENLPVSKHQDIVVKVATETTPKYKFDEKLGFLTWNPTIKAGQTKTFVLSYQVTIPSDWDM